jgi:hypothetical protein
MQCGGDAGGASAPIETGGSDAGELEGIGEIDQVLADGGLFGHAGSARAQACGTITAQVRHKHAETGFHERWDHLIVSPHIIREAVEQDDRKALRIAAFFVSDGESRRGNGLNRILRAGLRGQQDCRLKELSARQHRLIVAGVFLA